jgi:steroid delta-isomerase-like uncharacterized protein
MSHVSSSEAAKAVVRRNTEEVQAKGRFDVFDELFANDFTDHTPQPNTTPDKAGVRKLYTYIRAAFPDFHAEIHWQLADGDRVTTYKTYHGTHEGPFLGVAPTHRRIHFEAVDVMRVQSGKITDHWGVANFLSLMQQIGGWCLHRRRERGRGAVRALVPAHQSNGDAGRGRERPRVSSQRPRRLNQRPASSRQRRRARLIPAGVRACCARSREK